MTSVLPPATECLAPFSAAGVLEPVDVHLAATVARLAGDSRPTVVLGVALASRAPRLGHVCLDVARAASTVTVDGETTEALPWPEPEMWLADLVASPAVATAASVEGRHDDPRPLVLDGPRLYLERTWRDERLVAQRLLALATRAAHPSLVGTDAELDIALDRWFPAGDERGPDRQREAAMSMLTRGLTVVAGGPGTGKTRTLARVLALLRHQQPDRRVALAAPTGKAAARMGQAVAAQLVDAGVDPDTSTALLDEVRPVTLHRLLGLGPTRRRPKAVDADLVIVDEASMVGLSLMAELVRALPDHGRLVLVGDPHQLTSVEAGTVLADVVRAATAGGALAPCIVTLEQPYRFGAGSTIARLAAAVRAGDVTTVRDIVTPAPADDPRPVGGPAPFVGQRQAPRSGLPAVGVADDVRLVQHADALTEVDGAGIRALVLPSARAAWAAATAGDGDGALGALRSARLLCAHRTGHHGVDAWNRAVEGWLHEAEPGFDPRSRWHVGRPVLITRNDPVTGLANGDVGVVIRHTSAAATGAGPSDAETTDTSVRVAVERQGVITAFRPVQLPDVETFHAMTIHKSQGSEFDRVVVVLPPAESPLATRELLYTALTRGRREVVLVGTPAALEAAVRRVVSRASGLGELLARA